MDPTLKTLLDCLIPLEAYRPTTNFQIIKTIFLNYGSGTILCQPCVLNNTAGRQTDQSRQDVTFLTEAKRKSFNNTRSIYNSCSLRRKKDCILTGSDQDGDALLV